MGGKQFFKSERIHCCLKPPPPPIQALLKQELLPVAFLKWQYCFVSRHKGNLVSKLKTFARQFRKMVERVNPGTAHIQIPALPPAPCIPW